MKYIRVKIPNKTCSSFYIRSDELHVDVLTDLKQFIPKSKYQLMLRLKANNTSSKKVFTFGPKKTLTIAIDEVNAERVALKDKLAKTGSLKKESQR